MRIKPDLRQKTKHGASRFHSMRHAGYAVIVIGVSPVTVLMLLLLSMM